MSISILNLRTERPTTAGGTGGIRFTTVATTPVDIYLLQLDAFGQQVSQAFSALQAAPGPFFIPFVTPDFYRLLVYADGRTSQASEQLTLSAYVRVDGCTDLRATNYDGDATYDDGSCQYAPPAVPVPVFEVPLLNPLRFVQGAVLDDCAVFETPDNTLFCQQARPGMQRRPLFFQPVAYCDPVRLQVLTNYTHVDAVIHDHASGVVVPTATSAQPLTKVRALQGAAPFAQVELNNAGDGNTYLISATGGLAPSLLASARLVLRLSPTGPELTYRILRSGRASATVNDDYLVINRPWQPLPAGTDAAVSWQLSGPGFNVWEGELDLSALAPGRYEVRVHGYDNANLSATAISEPIQLAQAFENTVVVEYANRDNAYGLVFNTGIMPRLRFPGTYFRQKNAGTVTDHRNSDGTPVTLASTAQRLRTLEGYELPAWLQEKLYLIMGRLDVLRVNGVAGKAVGAWEWTEDRRYPLSSGRVDVEQVNWLGAGNSDDAGPNDTGDDFLVLRVGGFVKLRR